MEQAPNKLTILVENVGSKPPTFGDRTIVASFNPAQLSFTRVVNWRSQGAAHRDTPELQYTGAEARKFTIDLLFDTFDTPQAEKQDVRKITSRILHLTTIEEHGDKHRPPICQLKWGAAGILFEGVLEQIDQQFILFAENGMPVRAKLRCTFREWRTNQKDLQRQDLQSPDVAKIWIVKRGETLSDIAAHEYLDPRMWRPIAEANQIENPLDLRAGMTLHLPALPSQAGGG